MGGRRPGTDRGLPDTVDAGLRAHVQRVWLHPVDADSSVAVTLGTSPPAHHVAVEQYAVLPTVSAPKLLAPVGHQRSAAAALRAYGAARSPHSRLARRAMAVTMRSGVLDSRPRLIVSVDARVPRPRWHEVLLTEHLRRAVDKPDAIAVMEVRPLNPNAKPTVQLFDATGVPVAYVKLGTTTATKELVRREAAALTAVKGSLTTVLVPEMLGAGEWHDTSYAMGGALPLDIRRWSGRPEDTDAALRDIVASGTTSVSTFADSAHAAQMRADIAAATQHPDVASALGAWLERLAENPTPLQLGRTHGDWIPDNLGQSRAGLAVWDWEHSIDDAPVGSDLLHWHFKQGMDAGGLLAAVAAVEAATPSLRLLGVPPQARELVASLYLLHAFVRRLRLAVGGGGWNARWYPGLIAVARSRDMAAPR